MGVEIINDKMPFADLGMSFDRSMHMSEEVGFVTRRSIGNRLNLARGHYEVHHEGLSTVALIFKLLVLDGARPHGQGVVFTFPCLNPSQLISADYCFALFHQLLGLLVQAIDISYLRIKVFIDYWRQPIANQVRLQSPFLRNRAAWRGEICSTMPRFITSSAISRLVQWVMGRPDSSGFSQAICWIWHTWSGVMLAGPQQVLQPFLDFQVG